MSRNNIFMNLSLRTKFGPVPVSVPTPPQLAAYATDKNSISLTFCMFFCWSASFISPSLLNMTLTSILNLKQPRERDILMFKIPVLLL